MRLCLLLTRLLLIKQIIILTVMRKILIVPIVTAIIRILLWSDPISTAGGLIVGLLLTVPLTGRTGEVFVEDCGGTVLIGVSLSVLTVVTFLDSNIVVVADDVDATVVNVVGGFVTISSKLKIKFYTTY